MIHFGVAQEQEWRIRFDIQSVFIFRKKSFIYVNLFISSEITIGDSPIKIEQVTDFPKTDHTKLIIKEANNDKLTIHIRVPYWVTGEMNVTINGEKAVSNIEDGS